MFGLFKKDKGNAKNVVLKSPVVGRCFDLTEIPDEAFASKMMGEGFGVESTDGVMYAPADGEILQIFPTKHAILFRTREGLEILLHIGIETVGMNGEGFTAYREQGDKVKVGDRLISFDRDLIKAKAKTDLSPVVMANMDQIEDIQMHYGNTDKESIVANITLK